MWLSEPSGLRVSLPLLKLRYRLAVLSGEGPLHLWSPGCTALCSSMMSLRIPSRGPLTAHKILFLQLNTYGLSAFRLLFHQHPLLVSIPSLLLIFTVNAEKREAGYIRAGPMPRRHPQVRFEQLKTVLSVEFPQMCRLNAVREPEKKPFDFAFARMKKDRAGENTAKETAGESDSFLEKW